MVIVITQERALGALYYIVVLLVYVRSADLDRLLYKALQAPSFGESCVIPITVPY